MSRCIIHIGMHKTGTSSVQRSLKDFADDRLVYYPDHKRRANHGPTLFALVGSVGMDNRPDFSRKGGRGRPTMSRGVDVGMREIFARSVERLEGRDLLLSGEGAMFLSASELAALRALLAESFDEVTVVAYVRPPAAYMSSLFQQVIKGGTARRFDLEAGYCNYQRAFGKFDAAFGRDEVQLWKFDPATFPEGCVVRDFCSRLDIALPAERIVRVNESLPRHALALLYHRCKYGSKLDIPGEGRLLGDRLGTWLAQLGGGRLRFSADLMRPILERNRADIAWMEARLGESLEEDLGEHQPGDVRCEEDLLALDAATVETLRALVGDEAPTASVGDSPEAIAALLDALDAKATKAAAAAAKEPAGISPQSGRIMRASPGWVLGWAVGADMDHPVEMVLTVNGREAARALADKLRPALRDSGGHPTGQCGFAFRFAPDQALQLGDEVAVGPADGSFQLANSPCLVRNH